MSGMWTETVNGDGVDSAFYIVDTLRRGITAQSEMLRRMVRQLDTILIIGFITLSLVFRIFWKGMNVTD